MGIYGTPGHQLARAAAYAAAPLMAAPSAVMSQPIPAYSPYQNAWQQPPQLVSSYTSPEGYPLRFYTLSNGHRLIVEQRPTDIISLRTFINAGSINERPILNSPLYSKGGLPSGIAHLDEHCHFLSSENHPVKNSWANEVAGYGTDFNASTDSEVIQHEMVFNKERVHQMLALHAESVLRPVYNDSEISQEKTNVLNEASLRMSPPEQKILNKLHELLFDRPLAQTLGSREDVLGTTAEHLRQFHRNFYTPTNMITVVSGNIDPATLNNLLRQMNNTFGSNPARITPNTDAAMRIALKPGEIRHATIRDPQLVNSTVHLAFPAPPKASLRERAAMEFLADMLGWSPTSMLQGEIQERQRLATSTDVYYVPTRASGSFGIVMETTPGKEQKALAATLNTLASLSMWPVPEQKLSETRNRLLQSFQKGFNNVEGATYQLGDETLSNSLPYYLHYQQIVGSITPQDIMVAARKYLNPTTYAVVFGVPVKDKTAPPHTVRLA